MNPSRPDRAMIARELRRTAPPLRPPDQARVNRVCRNLPPAPRRRGAAFPRHLLAPLAAGLVLLAGLLIFVRRTLNPTRPVPHLPPVPHPAAIEAWISEQAPFRLLADEPDKLLADLATLIAVVDAQSIEILF